MQEPFGFLRLRLTHWTQKSLETKKEDILSQTPSPYFDFTVDSKRTTWNNRDLRWPKPQGVTITAPLPTHLAALPHILSSTMDVRWIGLVMLMMDKLLGRQNDGRQFSKINQLDFGSQNQDFSTSTQQV